MNAFAMNASTASLRVLPIDDQRLDGPFRIAATIALILLPLLGYYLTNADRLYKGFPLIGKAKGEWSNKLAKIRWATNSVEVVKRGMDEAGGKPFQVITPTGPLIVLPIDYLDDVKSNAHLDMTGWAKRDLLSSYPGLEVFAANDAIFTAVIRQKLTQALGGLTALLSEEAGVLYKEILRTAHDWEDISFNKVAEDTAARLSALVFLGRAQCRNQDWLRISVSYTGNCVATIRKASRIHSLLRPLVFRFLPEAALLQKQRRQAKAILEPEVLARRKALQEGQHESQDAVSWFEDMAKGKPYDFVSAQLSLSTAAIHTTSSTLLIIMYDILRHPDLIGPLREEITRVVREDGGWKKTTLYKLRLLDSVMKESIRITTVSPFAMRRKATETLVLHDGIKIPRGAIFMVSCIHLLNPANLQPNGDKFDGYRFYNLRQQLGEESRHQFVTTGPENMRFGHGTHACPGRFFAANEIKIALAHMLIKYDWRYKNDPPQGRSNEYEYIPDPKTLLQFKSRQPEIDF